jgi:hypothetical protein
MTEITETALASKPFQMLFVIEAARINNDRPRTVCRKTLVALTAMIALPLSLATRLIRYKTRGVLVG